MAEIKIMSSHKGDPDLRELMARHYSKPKGFVGRQLFYFIWSEGRYWGAIAFGSATRFLPGRKIVKALNHGMNNIFYHVEPGGTGYPCRNFTTKALLAAEDRAMVDWRKQYGDKVLWLETLVELPRTGELYRRAGYNEVGITKGYTCKREAGTGTDSWSGKRVWDTKNLRPKRVFYKAA